MPLGFRQLHAATLIDWEGDVEHPEFQLLIRRLHALIPPKDEQGKAPEPESGPKPEPRDESPTKSWLDRFVPRHPAAKPTGLLAVVFLANCLQTRVDAALMPAR